MESEILGIMKESFPENGKKIEGNGWIGWLIGKHC